MPDPGTDDCQCDDMGGGAGRVMTGLVRVLVVCAVLAAGLVATTAAAAPGAQEAATPAGITISGLDLHDGMILQADGAYLLYGTMYGCGFAWGVASPWCGFGVSRATSPAGPWSAPTRLFAPTSVSPFRGAVWQTICGDSGAGCFNPRMVHRTGWGADDGAWILWFNAPDDFARSRANAYYSMEFDLGVKKTDTGTSRTRATASRSSTSNA